MKKIAVLGAGSYGTAMAYHLAKKYENNDQFTVFLYGRNSETVDEINIKHSNKKYTSTSLPKNLQAHNDLEIVIQNADYIIMAIPAQSMREMARKIRPYIKQKNIIINLAKGLEIGSFKRMSQILKEELKEVNDLCSITSLGGPAFAKDIFSHHPIGVTLGGKSYNILEEIRSLFDTAVFDVKITKDVVGVELGGALKNVFGIMAGVMAGIDMGDSIGGDFLTRSIVDMKSFASYMGAKRATLDGRAGLGDLSITCTEGSRNFRFGREFAIQYRNDLSADEIFSNTLKALKIKTVEGYYTLEPLHQLCASRNMFVPIVNNLYKLLYLHTCSPEEAVHNYREKDKIRSREARLPISRILSFLFPRLWYRRERKVSLRDITKK